MKVVWGVEKALMQDIWHLLQIDLNKMRLGGKIATVTRTGNGYKIEWQSAPSRDDPLGQHVTVDTIDWMKVEDMKRYVEAQWILRR